MEQSTSSNNILSPPELSPLEQEVLEEYERLAENMKKVKHLLCITTLQRVVTSTLADTPAAIAGFHCRPSRLEPQHRDPRRPARA
jgi:hypothetical protein